MTRQFATVLATFVAVAALHAAPKFTSVWKSPEASQVSFAGKKVAALMITGDDSLRVSGEEALVRELTGRGMQAVATYRITPKEELAKAETAKGWFEKANVEGVVAMRPVKKENRTTYTPGMWVNPYYSTLWGYYGYEDTIVVVETTIYSVPRNALLWAAVSETKNPKTLGKFVEDLVKESVKELQKQGLARQLPK